MKNNSYEGLQRDIRKLKTPPIDTWDNEYSDKEYWVEFTINEFTCICPKTGLPDFATIFIQYVPHKRCVELKSLKLYMNFYRTIGIFHEHAVNKILEDFVQACNPRKVSVTGEFNIRGGIKTVVKASYNCS